MTLLFHTQDQQTTLQFYTDIVSSCIFSNPICFTSKYPESILSNYSTVIFSEHLLKSLIKQIVINNAQKLNDIKQQIFTHLKQHHLTQNHDFSEEHMAQVVNAMGQAIFNRLQEIKTVHLMESIAMGSLYLQDVNWKITKTISSSAKSFVGQKYPYIFALTLYLKNSQSGPQREVNCIKPVTLEMNKIQLKQFLTQLKAIKQEMSH